MFGRVLGLETERMSDRLLSLPQVAEVAGVSIWTIRRWIAGGYFPAPLKAGPRRVAWAESTVQAWIRERVEASQERK